MRYRSDIDGLRALAVVPVVLFHAGVPGFSGGFVGVDVFFVISGYLITSLIAEEMQAGRFSIVSFYERRARRILPALFVVLAFCCAVGWRLFDAVQYDALAKSVVATVLFSSNILFWKEAGYFDAPSLEKPLLHTWSLAVEEQFYILFPLLLLLIYRRFGGRQVLLVAGLAVLSLALSVVGVAVRPAATFYLAPTRAWELLLGALLALGAFPTTGHRWAEELAGLVGLGLIAWSVTWLSAADPFPGLNALYPTLGAALIIRSGIGPPTLASRLLGLGPLVFLGAISYSLYLWHWPLLVFASLLLFRVPTGLEVAGIVAASFVLAAVSWRYVERPFRRRGVPRRAALFAGASAAATVLIAFGVTVHLNDGWPGRASGEAERIAAYAGSQDSRHDRCMAWTDRNIPVDKACIYGADVTPTVAVWGDSHGDALIPMIGRLAAKSGVGVRFYGYAGCMPIAGIGQVDYPDCLSYGASVLDALLADRTVSTVVLVSRWSSSIEGPDEELGPTQHGLNPLPSVSDGSRRRLTRDEARALFRSKMTAMVARLVAAGKHLVLVYPIPETGYDVPHVLAQMVVFGEDPATFTRPQSYFARRQAFVQSVLDSLGPAGQIDRIYPADRLCDDTACIVYADGAPLYRDDNHLSLAGADYLGPLFEPIFRPQAERAALGAM